MNDKTVKIFGGTSHDPNLNNFNLVGSTGNLNKFFEIWAGAKLEPLIGSSVTGFNFFLIQPQGRFLDSQKKIRKILKTHKMIWSYPRTFLLLFYIVQREHANR